MSNQDSSPESSGTRPDVEQEERKQTVRETINAMGFAQMGLFVLAAGYTTFLIKPVLLPMIIALLLTLIFKPVQRRLQQYLRFPAPLAAFVVMLAAAAISTAAIISLSQPFVKYAEELRGDKVKKRLARMAQPLKEAQKDISDMAQEVQKITQPEPEPELKTETENEGREADGEPEPEPEPGTVDVEVKSGTRGSAQKAGTQVNVQTDAGRVSVDSAGGADVGVDSEKPPVKVQITSSEDPAKPLYTFASHLTIDFLATLALLFFFLAYGEIMIQRMAEVDTAANILKDLTRDVSYYLFSITAINLGLGLAIGLGMWFLGMPNPVLWGVMAALLNFVPYLGAIAGTGIVFIVATITFEHTSQILPVPLVYYLLTTVEGNFVTPAIIGKRFTLNPIIVFAWVFCWGIMWGVSGMLIGLPLLMVFRIVCAKLPSLARVERVISL